MEHIDDNPFESSSSVMSEDRVEIEPEDLLEDSWFFGNSPHGRLKTMSRCFSDPSSSSSSSFIYQELMKQKKSSGGDRGPVSSGLIRSPSLPSSMAKEEGTERRGRKSKGNSENSSLVRTPSLPPSFGKEEEERGGGGGGGEEEDAESEFALSRLIRQASLNSNDVLPPRSTPKGVKKGSSAPPRNRPPRKQDQESSIDINGCDQMRGQYLDLNQTKLRKSMSDLGSPQVQQELKGLGLKLDRTEMNLSTPQERLRGPYHQAANWVEKSSSSEDMKAQIKFWARSVAANVR